MKTVTKPKTTATSGKLPYLINSRDGVPHSLAIMVGGRPQTLSASHQSFGAVIEELKKPTHNAKRILSLISAQEALLDFSNKTVTIANGKVYYQGNAIGGALVNRILEFNRVGLPYEPLLKFLQNLPEKESARDALYKFLENKGLTITPDGCFLGYKGVRRDYTSAHPNNLPSLKGPMIKGHIRFKVGDKPRCNREDCDPNTSVECSTGIHVGSHSFAQGYTSDGHMMIVKVNPRDCVSVPHYSGEKIRVCALEVVGDLKDSAAGINGRELKGPYTNPKKLKRKLAVLQKRAGKKRRSDTRKRKLARRNRKR